MQAQISSTTTRRETRNMVDADRWLHAKPTLRDRCARFWIWFLLSSSRRWPWMAQTTRPFWVWWAWHCSPTLRRITTTNARWLLGASSTAAQRRHLGWRVVDQLFCFLHDMARCSLLDADGLRRQIERVDGEEHFETARRLGRGVIVATAHIGSFEVGMAALREREPGPIHVLFHRDRLAQFEQLRLQLHRKLNITDASLEDGWTTWARLRDALRRDEVVVLQTDRVMPGQKGESVPFFQGTVRFPTGAVRLASLTEAPILPIFAVRTTTGRIRIVVRPAIHVGANGERSALLQLSDEIERQVRAAPEQWLVLYRPWEQEADRNG